MLQTPVDWRDAVRRKIGVGLREMAAAEKSAVGRKRRGVRRGQHQMAAAVDHGDLFLGVDASQHKHQMLAFLVQAGDHAVGKGFPAEISVRVCLMGAHGKHGVEQQHALFRP